MRRRRSAHISREVNSVILVTGSDKQTNCVVKSREIWCSSHEKSYKHLLKYNLCAILVWSIAVTAYCCMAFCIKLL